MRLLLLIISFFASFSLFSQETIYYKSVEPGKMEVLLRTEQWQSAKQIVIKGFLTKEDVHYLGSQLRKHHNIKKVDLKKSEFKEIGLGVFSDCIGLEEIILPKSLKTIAKRAFYNCENLKEITIPNKVVSIGTEAFANCEKMESLVIGKKVSWIGSNAFMNCNNVRKIRTKQNKAYKTKYNQLYDENGKRIAGMPV